ncbi:MAG: hypothetical protein QOJ03_1599 [Frankiaceae bacterium]|nr:hypothetical protein [Frankiaceae bacterium]
MSGRQGDAREPSEAEIWNELGRLDPYWAVLARSRVRLGGWLPRLTSFYTTGVEDVAACMTLTPDADFSQILDYGSGTGRLSFALAPHAELVSCVDLSVTMQDRLRDEATVRQVTNLRFLSPQDPPVPGHTWAISLLTLQHLPGHDGVRDALRYIRDSLVPGGFGVIEVPTATRSVLARVNVTFHPQWRLYRAARRMRIPAPWLIRHGIHGIYFHVLSASALTQLMGELGLTVTARSEGETKHYSFVRYGFVRSTTASP